MKQRMKSQRRTDSLKTQWRTVSFLAPPGMVRWVKAESKRRLVSLSDVLRRLIKKEMLNAKEE